MSLENGRLAFFIITFQVILLLSFILFGKYSIEADASYMRNSLNINYNGINPKENLVERYFHGKWLFLLFVCLLENIFYFQHFSLSGSRPSTFSFHPSCIFGTTFLSFGTDTVCSVRIQFASLFVHTSVVNGHAHTFSSFRVDCVRR